MKSDIHPAYFLKAAVKCACGNTFTVGSTKEKIDVEVCSACHPFYVGDESKKILAGRMEKFKTRQSTTAAKREEAKKHATAKKTKKASLEVESEK
ncbi:MAG: 50S ribosomal protein L31 [Candidatus Campbellbacteria bacterium]|nr:50S ribosomal protein L31 [Candidatus Campbellbacteria bacterium]